MHRFELRDIIFCCCEEWRTQIKLSDYVEGLPEEAKRRYKQKISFIGGVDPFPGGFSSGLQSESESSAMHVERV